MEDLNLSGQTTTTESFKRMTLMTEIANLLVEQRKLENDYMGISEEERDQTSYATKVTELDAQIKALNSKLTKTV